MTIPKFLGSTTAGNIPTGGTGAGKLGLRELAFNMADGKIFTYNGTKVVELAPGKGDANVQSDWNQQNAAKDDFIKNKPHLGNQDLTPFVKSTKTATTGKITDMISITQHDYDAIPKPDPRTLYIII